MTNIGVIKTYLAKEENGKIIKTMTFIRDYRPACNKDERKVELNEMGGCIWYNYYKYFSNNEEGNSFYKEALNEGFRKSTMEEVDNFIHKCSMMTY